MAFSTSDSCFRFSLNPLSLLLTIKTPFPPLDSDFVLSLGSSATLELLPVIALKLSDCQLAATDFSLQVNRLTITSESVDFDELALRIHERFLVFAAALIPYISLLTGEQFNISLVFDNFKEIHVSGAQLECTSSSLEVHELDCLLISNTVCIATLELRRFDVLFDEARVSAQYCGCFYYRAERLRIRRRRRRIAIDSREVRRRPRAAAGGSEFRPIHLKLAAHGRCLRESCRHNGNLDQERNSKAQ
jgi:hypothetical protein